MVRIVQLICPKHHCIMGGAYEEGRSSYEETVRLISDFMKSSAVEHRCALCGSTDLHFEDARTKFQTLQEAAPYLAEQQRQNAMTRALIEHLRTREAMEFFSEPVG